MTSSLFENVILAEDDPILSTVEAYKRDTFPQKVRTLQSYLSTSVLRKLTVVFKYFSAKETYSRI